MCQVAESHRVRLISNPTTAATIRPTPSNVPSPTAISVSAMPTPVTSGNFASRFISGATGVAWANPWSCVPT